jgi:hypothetical protein
MPELSFRLIMDTGDASVKLSEIKRETEDVKGAVESPKKTKNRREPGAGIHP